MTDSNDNKFKTRKTTIAALGPNLPIGLASPNGSLETGLAARPWRLKEEKQLARLRAEENETSFTGYVSTILGTMLSKIGPANLDEIPTIVMRKLTVGQMYMADVFYAYVWLRIQAIGHELVVPVKCPKCSLEFNFKGDLTTTEVTVPEDKANLEWEFLLRHPITIRNKTVTGFRVGQQIWSGIESSNVNDGNKASVIANSVRGFLGEVDSHGKPLEANIMIEELDELSKYDLERLVKEIDDRFLGPKMALDIVCIKETCRREWVASLNWYYDSFFSVSSI